jgi:hypothetical protein
MRGAMISKNQKVDWFQGTFIETVKEWQHDWFNVTEPLAADQAEVPAPSAGPPRWLASWRRKGMDWGNPEEVTELQQKIKFLVDKKKVKLVDVVDVMVQRRILPLQLWASPMWAFKPEDTVPVNHFFCVSLSGMWMTLFKPSKNESPPPREGLRLRGRA